MPAPITLISCVSYHRHLTLQTASHGSLTITYTDLGKTNGPCLLYLPGAFASRYLGLQTHAIAERAGVRLLVIDRPGMGGSTNVDPEKRVSAWVESFPLLLKQLAIQKVALVSHSAGTIYLLNSWARHRDLLTGQVFCLAPWVDPAHSGVTTMQAAQYIPVKLFNYWHQIPRFFVTQASPVLASSGAVVKQVSGSMSGSMSSVSNGLRGSLGSGNGTSNTEHQQEDSDFLHANYMRLQRDYGVPIQDSEELAKLAMRSMFEERTVGANGEVLVCLRKTRGKGDDWGACADYNQCAELLQQTEVQRHTEVRLRTYFAEKDAMIGSQGQRYFEKCWAWADQAHEHEHGHGQAGVDFATRTIQGTDHDSVTQSVEVWEEILSLIAQ